MTELIRQPTIAGVRVWEPLRGPFERWPLSADLSIALVSFSLTILMWSQGSSREMLALDSVSDVGIFLCAFVGNFALLWRRSHPWQVHVVVLSASILVMLGGMSDGVFALAFSLYSLGRYEGENSYSLIGMLAALMLVVTDLFVLSEPSVGGTIAAGLVVSFWYVGRRLRFRGEYLRLLEERADYLERKRDAEAERAVAAERTRIAREMHDIVAHQVSLMTVQAGAARTVCATDPTAAADAMVAVEKAGRNALTEMRHLLDVLRPIEQQTAIAPQPGISDLPALVQEVRDAGPVVNFRADDDYSALPARLQLAVYRIVQETLTNVIKHAGDGVVVTGSVDIGADAVVVQIRDNGKGGAYPGDSTMEEQPGDENITGKRIADKAGGHGIVGMRERVELLDGILTAGAIVGSGFEIRAEFPISRNPQ